MTANYGIPARSPTALQIYVLACLIFVSVGILEYSLIRYKSSPFEEVRKQWMMQRGSSNKEDFQDVNSSSIRSEERSMAGHIKAEVNSESGEENGKDIKGMLNGAFDMDNIDIISRILFPFLFVIFNFIYWIYFLV